MNSSDKWTQINTTNESDLQPGDILVSADNSGQGRNHIFVYLGGGKSAGANLDHWYGRVGNLSEEWGLGGESEPFYYNGNKYKVFRTSSSGNSASATNSGKSALSESQLEEFAQNNILFYDPSEDNCDPDQHCSLPTGSQITWIGDSYSTGAQSVIEKKFSGISFGDSTNDANSTIQACKFVGTDTTCNANPTNPSGLDVLERVINAGELKAYLVFALGTNGGWSDSDVTRFKSIIADEPDVKVIFVNSKTPKDDYSTSNSILKSLADSNNNYYLADWAAAYNESYFPEVNGSKDIHPSVNGGYEKWVDTIANIMPQYCTDGVTADGVTTVTYEGSTIAFPLAGATKDSISGGRGSYTFLSNIPCNDSVGCHYGPSTDPAFDICFTNGEDCIGATVVSMTDGEVVRFSQSRNGAYCNGVGIKSNLDGTVFGYYHMEGEENGLYIGQQVHAGDVIGHVSGNGPCHDNSTPHVHVDKGTDPNATWGAGGSDRDTELIDIINTVYEALPEDDSEMTSRKGTSSPISVSSTSSGDNKNYAGEDVWTEGELEKIEENKSVYESTAREYNIPWQIIAVMHSLETGLSRSNPSNGQGLYQLYSYTDGGTNSNAFLPAGEVSEAEFQRQTNLAAEVMIQKVEEASLDLNTDDGIKYLLFSYNGIAEEYKNKSLCLFPGDQHKADIGEGSPYVMNKYDAQRDPDSPQMSSCWPGRYVADGVYDSSATQSGPGGYVKYIALGGGTDGSNYCPNDPKGEQSNVPIGPVNDPSDNIACDPRTIDLGIRDDAYYNGEKYSIRLCSIPNIKDLDSAFKKTMDSNHKDDGYIHVNSRVSGAFYALSEEHKNKCGNNLEATEGFRTEAMQAYYWNCYQTGSCNGGNLAAAVGYSNHQGGLAIDFNTGSYCTTDSDVASGGAFNLDFLAKFGLKDGRNFSQVEYWHVEPSGD